MVVVGDADEAEGGDLMIITEETMMVMTDKIQIMAPKSGVPKKVMRGGVVEEEVVGAVGEEVQVMVEVVAGAATEVVVVVVVVQMILGGVVAKRIPHSRNQEVGVVVVDGLETVEAEAEAGGDCIAHATISKWI